MTLQLNQSGRDLATCPSHYRIQQSLHLVHRNHSASCFWRNYLKKWIVISIINCITLINSDSSCYDDNMERTKCLMFNRPSERGCSSNSFWLNPLLGGFQFIGYSVRLCVFLYVLIIRMTIRTKIPIITLKTTYLWKSITYKMYFWASTPSLQFT